MKVSFFETARYLPPTPIPVVDFLERHEAFVISRAATLIHP